MVGIAKAQLRQTEVDCNLDVREAILKTGIRDDAGTLGVSGHAHVPRFTAHRITGVPLVPSLDFKKHSKEHFAKLKGHSCWSDVRFTPDGCLQWKVLPCGDSEGSPSWSEKVQFANTTSMSCLKSIRMADISPAPLSVMPSSRKAYLQNEVLEFVTPCPKTFSDYGTVQPRELIPSPDGEHGTAPSPIEGERSVRVPGVDYDLAMLEQAVIPETISRARLDGMRKQVIIEELRKRKPELYSTFDFSGVRAPVLKEQREVSHSDLFKEEEI